jgi:hypothetical protein
VHIPSFGVIRISIAEECATVVGEGLEFAFEFVDVAGIVAEADVDF